jgi:hypothetical protein
VSKMEAMVFSFWKIKLYFLSSQIACKERIEELSFPSLVGFAHLFELVGMWLDSNFASLLTVIIVFFNLELVLLILTFCLMWTLHFSSYLVRPTS